MREGQSIGSVTSLAQRISGNRFTARVLPHDQAEGESLHMTFVSFHIDASPESLCEGRLASPEIES